MNYKKYKITLKNKKGEMLEKEVKELTFPEAVKNAYYMVSQKQFEYEIISVKKISK